MRRYRGILWPDHQELAGCHVGADAEERGEGQGDYSYTVERTTSLKGDTDPYLLEYAHVRLSSMEPQNPELLPISEIDVSFINEPKARDIGFHLRTYPEASRMALSTRELSGIVINERPFLTRLERRVPLVCRTIGSLIQQKLAVGVPDQPTKWTISVAIGEQRKERFLIYQDWNEACIGVPDSQISVWRINTSFSPLLFYFTVRLLIY